LKEKQVEALKVGKDVEKSNEDRKYTRCTWAAEKSQSLVKLKTINAAKFV
jgi:type IV secretory pathway VirD2 relaxase